MLGNAVLDIIINIIINDFTEEKYTIDKLVHTLIEIYNNLFKNESLKQSILEIIGFQYKKEQMNAIQEGSSLDDIITTGKNYLTEIDYIVLSIHFNVPLIIMSRTAFPSINSDYLYVNTEKIEYCYIILGSAFNRDNANVPPFYGIIERNDSIKLSNAELAKLYQKVDKSNMKIGDVQKYIDLLKKNKQEKSKTK
jgi:hypothetical protein